MMSLVSSSDLRNFIYDDCLKDYLILLEGGDNAPTTFKEHIDFLLTSEEFPGAYPTFTIKKTYKWIAIISRNDLGDQGYFYNVVERIYTNVQRYLVRQLISKTYNVDFGAVGVLELNNITQKLTEPHINVEDAKKWIEKGTHWLEILRSEWRQWSLTELLPNNVFLMPNTTLPYVDQYTEKREKLAWQWKDIGLLYYIGASTRSKLHSYNIYTLNHPHLFRALKEVITDVNILMVQKTMLDPMFLPIVPLSVPIKLAENVETNVETNVENYAYLDIETTKEHVHVVGIVYTSSNGVDEYVSFVSKDSSSLQLSEKWMDENIPSHTIVHYTSADCIAIPQHYKRLDLYDVVREQFLKNANLQKLHLNSFKLKTIYKNLCVRLGTKNLYENCAIKNGLQAMHKLEKWILPTVDLPESIDDVIEYNKVDCIALKDLQKYLSL